MVPPQPKEMQRRLPVRPGEPTPPLSAPRLALDLVVRLLAVPFPLLASSTAEGDVEAAAARAGRADAVAAASRLALDLVVTLAFPVHPAATCFTISFTWCA